MEPDAVDAAGRHGIAVSRSSQGTRYEWIFDRTSLVMIGEREVRNQDSKIGAAASPRRCGSAGRSFLITTSAARSGSASAR